MSITRQELVNAINSCSESLNLGSSETGPSDEWIDKAEARLGFKLPDSYKWFLKSYGGGEIYGDEVYSIYQMDFNTVNGGDIVFHYIIDQRQATLEKDELAIMQTDQGEIFYFNVTGDDMVEYPVYCKIGKNRFKYANDFIEFIMKRLGKC